MANAGASALLHITMADPGLARRVSRTPGALSALVATVAAGGKAALGSSIALATLAGAGSALARRVAATSGALPALVASVAASGAHATPGERQAAENSALTLGKIAGANDPGLARRVAGVPGALPALASCVAAGGRAASYCASSLVVIAAAGPELAQRVAEVPGALAALAAAAAAGGNAGKYSTWALAEIAAADSGLAQPVAEVPRALTALVGRCCGG